MERIPRGIYTQEFREQAVRLHEVDGLTIPEGRDAEELGLCGAPGQAGRSGQEPEAADRVGNGIGADQARAGGSQDGARPAKKAAAYFARESR